MKKTTADKILMILKMKGDVSLANLALELGITKEGARLHLVKLLDKGFVQITSRVEGVGRPVTYYSLSKKGLSKFPDTHAQVTVDLLSSIKTLLGENALELLINDREKKVYQKYERELITASNIEERLNKLSEIRSKEGYMAKWKKKNGEYYFIENHCPICAAATLCQNFCKSELKNFRQLIGNEFYVERIQHIITGEKRCTYRISEKTEITSS